MVTAFLVRHAAHDAQGRRLVGRQPGVTLAPGGQVQAVRLARFFAISGADVVQSSPQQRAQETAAPMAAAIGLNYDVVAALDEIDFGDWSGRDIDQLDGDPAWDQWNNARGSARPPNGESMLEVQTRIVDHLVALWQRPSEYRAVLISHGDVIKAAVMQILDLSLDAHARFQIDPASVTTIAAGSWGAKVVAMNERIVG